MDGRRQLPSSRDPISLLIGAHRFPIRDDGAALLWGAGVDCVLPCPAHAAQCLQVVPGVLANYETSLRDPAFYYFYKYITSFFRQYAYTQPAYKYDDLSYPGVSIKNIEVDKLYTYFDYFNVDVSNAFYVKNAEEAKSLNYVARSLRLNHEPFNYKVSKAPQMMQSW